MGNFPEVFTFNGLFLKLNWCSFVTIGWFSLIIARHAHNYNDMLRTITWHKSTMIDQLVHITI
jgi:hypothetical protein